MSNESWSVDEYQAFFNTKKPSTSRRPKKDPGTPANVLTTKALNYLRQFPDIDAWRQNNTAVYDPKKQCYRKFKGRKGISDIIGVYRPLSVLFGVEIKTLTDRTSPEQKAFIEMLNEGLGFGIAVKGDAGIKKLHEEFPKWRKKMIQIKDMIFA